MAPREDLVNSAVNFLQDPSVASSPLDKRRAFLSSKNLTEEEISLALARAGSDSSSPSPSTSQSYAYPPPPPPGYSYPQNYPYAPPPWTAGQPPFEPPPPRRDWRDWFIMATVTAGVGYGVYTAAKRYIIPLISPPTPPQLETDKTAIDASFARAFALIDQLSTDTAALKAAEEARTEKLDKQLEEVEAVVQELKESNRRREEEARRIGDDVRGLREMVPKALEGWKGEEEGRLRELRSELSGLRVLVGNRVGGQAGQVGGQAGGPRSGASTPAASGTSGVVNGVPSASAGSGGSEIAPASSVQEDTTTAGSSGATVAPAPAPGVTSSKRDGAASPFSFDRQPAQRAIPSWQLAASKGKSSGGEGSAAEGDPGSSGS